MNKRLKKYISYSYYGLFLLFLIVYLTGLPAKAQDRKLTKENIKRAYEAAAEKLGQDTLRPAYHLLPPSGSMGDPNGGIYFDGWYHIFYGHQPFGPYPGAWFWAHARSRDLLQWEHMEPALTPAFNLGLDHVGSGSAILTKKGVPLAFYSSSRANEPMKFWRAEFNEDLTEWEHKQPNPILTLNHPGLPEFDEFWRDPFVFNAEGRTFLIACADQFESDRVDVPIFEASNQELTEWEYRGILFSVPKHEFRNLEVPEFHPLGDKWIFMASSDAPVDRVYYFTGIFDTQNLRFKRENSGIIDYSGHYYAQEGILDNKGDLYLMAWIPGWDREWLPYYMNEPRKNSSPLWNGAFALPRRLSVDQDGGVIQRPVEVLKELRDQHSIIEPMELPVTSPFTAIKVLEEVRGDQLEIQIEFDLHTASLCGLNVLSDQEGQGGLPITWSGDMLNVDGVNVPIEAWQMGDPIHMQIFIDKKIVEVFINEGRYCVSRQLEVDNIKGDFIALTSLGGTAMLKSMEVWEIRSLK